MEAIMKRNGSNAWTRLAVVIGVYAGLVVLLVVSQTVFKNGGLPLYILVPVALVPLIPAVWGVAGWLEAVRHFDERQGRIQTEAGLFSLGMTTLAALSYGLLEATAGFPKLSMFWVVPFVALTFSIGGARARWRYR